MKTYNTKIALVENSRGMYYLDSSMGCASGMDNEPGGCYNDCYAAKAAKLYGYDFSKTVLRDFINRAHIIETIKQINKIKLPFVRIGCSGDPSENWQHCLKIVKIISTCTKEIVIITKHWTNLTDEQLQFLSTINICINTSVSALDKPLLLENSLTQHHRIKPYCKSVLRIVSCDFNIDNETGHRLYKLQESLFLNESIIDTVFRPSAKNKLVTDDVINIRKGVFNGSKQLMSKYRKKTYTGKCSTCKEMCGVNVSVKELHPGKMPLLKQQSLL